MKKKRILFVITIFLLLFSVVTPFIPIGVQSEPRIEGIAASNDPFLNPVVFTETSDYVKLDNDLTFILEFYKGSTGYNKIYYRNGSVLVYDDRITIEYLSGTKWKQRGTPTHVTWDKLADNHYEVIRHYDDYIGTTFTITYTVRTGYPIKITVDLNSGQTDEYRILWSPSGITCGEYSSGTNKAVFGDDTDVQLGFDWSDVYQIFGDITTTSVETKANGKKLTVSFNIGIVEAGQTLTLDPVIIDYNDEGYSAGQGMAVLHPSAVLQRSATGQSFSVTGSNYILTSVRFYMIRDGSPTGNAYAKLYAHTGTYGYSSRPTGAVLATSDAVDISTITNVWPGAFHTFTFSGAQQYEMQKDTYYVIVFENPTAGSVDVDNNIVMAGSHDYLEHAGNWAVYYYSAWYPSNLRDCNFYVYGTYVPPITRVTITDMDDTDNCYAMKKYYTFKVVVGDELSDEITKVYLRGNQSTTRRFEVRGTGLNETPVWTIQSGADVIDLDTGTCTWSAVGYGGTATFKIRFEWDYVQEENLEILLYVEDASLNSIGFTVYQTNYFDIITRLSTTGFVSDATYVPKGENVTLSGSVRYSTTIDGDTSSTSYPPNAQFTAVHIRNASDTSVGSDTTILSGVFSVEITTPDVAQTNTYHVYLDLVAPYTDANASDGDTVIVYGGSWASLLFSFDDETGTTIAYDLSEDDNDGAIEGATRTGYGKYGKALSFDGVNDYVNVTDDSSLDFATEVSISAWIKTSDADFQTIVVKQYAYGLFVTDNFGIRMTINDTSVDTNPDVINSDEWTFITGTFDGTNVRIYIDGVIDTTRAVTGGINITETHLFVGRSASYFFNGTIDEVRAYGSVLTQSEIVAYMDDPIATFPYNLQGSITDIECTDWVFAGDTYTFVNTYVTENVTTYPFDTLAVGFYDGVSWTLGYYDDVDGTWSMSSGVAYLVDVSDTTEGNEITVTFEIYLLDTIFDELDVDLWMYCNVTTADEDAWEIVEADYFNIYNHGGMPEYDSSGGGFSVAGEGVFGLAVQNTSSWAYANITWRKLQHVNFLVHWWSNTSWDAGNAHWDCPSEHNNTGYVEYGINYWYNGSWLEGWKVRLEIEDGEADSNDAWVLVNATWYNREVYVTHEEFYAFYEAHTSTDTSTQFALYVDLWVGLEGGSSTVGGRVNAEYFGINKTGWGPWATWGPVTGLEDESVFFDTLKDVSGNAISAEGLELFIAWANFTKTSNQTGLGSPGCDTHQWGLIDYSGPYWRTLPPTSVMRGISMPMPTPTITPGEVSVGFFAALITAMIEGITAPIVAAIEGTVSTLWFISKALIDASFDYFAGFKKIGFVDTMTTMVETFIGYFADSVTNITALVVQIFIIITTISGFLISALTRLINFFFDSETGLFVIVGGIFDGTSTLISGLTSFWGLISPDDWPAVLDFLTVMSVISWIYSIDNRARRIGGGWVAIFIGDLQIVYTIFSFMLDWMFRVINTVMDLVFRLMSMIPGLR